jgi:AraC-like DNA-binding protein
MGRGRRICPAQRSLDAADEATPRALPTVTGFAVRCAIAALEKHDIAVQPLLFQAGLSELEVLNPKHRISAVAQGHFLEYAAEAIGDTAFGLHLAEQSNPREVGLIFYLTTAASNLAEALALFVRYFRIVNESVRFRLVHEPERIVVEFFFVGVSQHRVKQNTEFWLGMIVRAAREVTRRHIKPTGVVCPHLRNENLREFARFFGCPVEFGAPIGQMAFSNEAVALPLITEDPYLLEMLRPFCEEAEKERNTIAGSFRASVENEVARLLPHAQAKAEIVAKALALSVGTLSRKLSVEKTTFDQVVDQMRRSLALQYLKESCLTLAQIAWLLGYESPISFKSAFRRWTGRSPTAVRDDKLHRATK